MNLIPTIEMAHENGRELFPDSFQDFPYLATLVELDRFLETGVPWHWHGAMELFYMESGEIEYSTPSGSVRLPAGAGGLVNAGVLHMTRPLSRREKNVQLIHLFDPAFLAGPQEGRIFQKYALPLLSREDVHLIPLLPDAPEKAALLQELRASFQLDPKEWGYEFRLRETLSRLWLKLLLLIPRPAKTAGPAGNDSRLQAMLTYLYQHYDEPIQISQLAKAALVSQRECYRLFQQCLHCPPGEYLIRYRLQMACSKLVNTRESLTSISQSCGFGSGSYFAKLFRREYRCTPSEYRQRWQDRNNL